MSKGRKTSHYHSIFKWTKEQLPFWGVFFPLQAVRLMTSPLKTSMSRMFTLMSEEDTEKRGGRVWVYQYSMLQKHLLLLSAFLHSLPESGSHGTFTIQCHTPTCLSLVCTYVCTVSGSLVHQVLVTALLEVATSNILVAWAVDLPTSPGNPQGTTVTKTLWMSDPDTVCLVRHVTWCDYAWTKLRKSYLKR